MSLEGWVNTIDGKADRVLSYFFTSLHSQTIAYRERVQSLPYLVAKFYNDTYTLRSRVEDALELVLNAYFNSVDVGVSIDPLEGAENTLDLRISVTVTEDGIRYDLTYLISTTDSTINSIVRHQNG